MSDKSNCVSDNEVIAAMIRYGGSFAQALGHAARLADSDNLERIKSTWPEYWFRYSAMANQGNQVAAALLEKHPMAEYQKDE